MNRLSRLRPFLVPLAALLVIGALALAPTPAFASTSGGTAIGTALNEVNRWKNDTLQWLPVMCVLAWVATGITLLLQGVQINPVLITFAACALGSTFVLIGPAFIQALSGILGFSGAVV